MCFHCTTACKVGPLLRNRAWGSSRTGERPCVRTVYERSDAPATNGGDESYQPGECYPLPAERREGPKLSSEVRVRPRPSYLRREFANTASGASGPRSESPDGGRGKGRVRIAAPSRSRCETVGDAARH